MRLYAAFLGGILIFGCSKTPPAAPDPVRDSLSQFVAEARTRAKEKESGSYRIEFHTGYGYSPATEQEPATGSVSLRIVAEVERRRILQVEPALSLADYDLKFTYRDEKWEFKEGTVKHKLTERYITHGRKPNELEPERTDAIQSLEDRETLRFLFFGKKP